MPTSAKDFKRLAETYAVEALTEPRRRSVISRAYYAAYHRCLRWERLLPVRSSVQANGGTHKQLIDRLNHPDLRCGPDLVQRSKDIAELLDQGLKRRRRADYQLDDAVDVDTMDHQLEATRQIFAKCADGEN